MSYKYKVKVTDRYEEVSGYNLTIKEDDGGDWPVYILKTKRNDYTLYPNFRGKEVMRLTDTGNEIIVKRETGETFTLDFGEREHLLILLMAENYHYTKADIKIKAKEDATN